MTAMPGGTGRPSVRSRGGALLARNSLALGVVLATQPSCLVTGSTDFEEPAPTRPILTVVEPAVTELLRVAEPTPTFAVQQFSVQVLSEDGGQNLEAALLLDYGVTVDVGEEDLQPYRIINRREIAAGTLSDTNRLVTIPYQPAPDITAECHSVTMMVVRNPYGSSPYDMCPTDENFATVTWFVALCRGDASTCSYLDCPIKGEEPYTYCPNPSELTQTGGGT